MAFTDAIDVAVGDAILASHIDNLADNTEWLRALAAVDHDFDITTGTGYHKAEIHLVNAAGGGAAATLSLDTSGIVRIVTATGTTTPPVASTTQRISITTDGAGPSF